MHRTFLKTDPQRAERYEIKRIFHFTRVNKFQRKKTIFKKKMHDLINFVVFVLIELYFFYGQTHIISYANRTIHFYIYFNFV